MPLGKACQEQERCVGVGWRKSRGYSEGRGNQVKG